MRLIDADDMEYLEELEYEYRPEPNGEAWYRADDVWACIDKEHTVDLASLRPKGEWVLEAHNDQANYGWYVTPKCPNCGKETKRIWAGFFLGFTDEQVVEIALQRATVKLDNFCPNCGCDMRRDDNG